MQVEADDIEIESIRVTNAEFSGNAEDGINVRKDSGVIASISLISVLAAVNAESGLDIDADGPIKLNAVTSENNGAPDVLP